MLSVIECQCLDEMGQFDLTAIEPSQNSFVGKAPRASVNASRLSSDGLVCEGRFVMSKRIPLTQGQYAIVDDEDYKWLNQWKWCYSQGRAVRGAGKKEKRKILLMHRVIMNAPPHLVVDHINRNTLDNKKSNLRICTKRQNNINRAPNSTPMSSRHKGVCWRDHAKKWKAYIKTQGKQIHLGYFENEKDAARAYNKTAQELFGEFARLNEV